MPPEAADAGQALGRTRLVRAFLDTFQESTAASESNRVIYTALTGDIAIAIAKLAAFALSGSSAMLTEAFHSFVDSADQVLLLVGERRARKQRDRTPPLGYGMETYFWSFVVAVMVMLAGGVASLYEGLHRLSEHADIASPTVSFLVLGIATIFEGWSFRAGFHAYKRVVRARDTALWTFIRQSKDPGLFATLLEDSAGLAGIGLAALGVLGSTVLHQPWADGAASIGIGVLLVAVAIVLANEPGA